jgi:hypothetical protein
MLSNVGKHRLFIKSLVMKSFHNFQRHDVTIIQNSEVNNVSKVVILSKKENTKSGVRLHGPPTNAKVRLAAMEE